MRELTILIGCWVKQFIDETKFFNYLEKRFDCKIKKVNYFLYRTQINNIRIEFQFCFGPNDDELWQERKRIRAKEGLRLPPSIEHLAKRGIKTKEIYYLGFCGVLEGKRNEAYLPNKFVKVSFPKYFIDANHIDRVFISKKISYPNKLIGVIKGYKCTSITSNQVLSLKYILNKSKEILSALAERFVNHAHVVEMENYEIIKRFGKNHIIGSLLFSTDVPKNKKYQLGGNPVKSNWNKFNRIGSQMIEKIVKGL